MVYGSGDIMIDDDIRLKVIQVIEEKRIKIAIIVRLFLFLQFKIFASKKNLLK